jgi:hypothetical protein
MKRISQFIIAICKTWGVLLTGGFLIAILASWQLTGHTITPKLGWTIIVLGVLVAAFQVWKKQVDVADKLRAEIAEMMNSSKLVIVQKKDSGYYGTKSQGDGAFLIYVTMLIANQSNKANSVMAYKAEIMKTDGTYESLKVEQGQTPNFKFCVTPLNIAPSSTVEAVLGFMTVNPARYGQPFKMNITAVDVEGKEFTGNVQF